MSENRDERINRALALLRQKVTEVLELEPRIMEINDIDEIVSKEKRKTIEDKIWFIFSYGEYYVAKLMSDIGDPMVVGKTTVHFDFYRNYKRKYIEKDLRIDRYIKSTNAQIH